MLQTLTLAKEQRRRRLTRVSPPGLPPAVAGRKTTTTRDGQEPTRLTELLPPYVCGLKAPPPGHSTAARSRTGGARAPARGPTAGPSLRRLAAREGRTERKQSSGPRDLDHGKAMVQRPDRVARQPEDAGGAAGLKLGEREEKRAS